MTINLTGPLQELANRITSAIVHGPDPYAATIDRTKVNLPGALVQLVDVDTASLLSEVEISARVVLITNDRDDVRSLESLQTMLDVLLQVIDPADRITGGLFPLPNQPHPMPCLVVPVTLYTTYPGE